MQIIDQEEFKVVDGEKVKVVDGITINGKPYPIIEKMVNGRPYRTVMTEDVKVPNLATYTEIAELLRVSLSTVERWERKGYMPSAIRIDRTVRFDVDEINQWLKRKGALQTANEMRAEQWVTDTGGGATIESMREERGLPVNQDLPTDIDLDLAAMKTLLDEIDEITAGERTAEKRDRLLKARAVFESLREKIRPLRENHNGC